MARTPTPPESITAAEARTWWKALITNACALVDDAHTLAEQESFGRAGALVVLGMEELAKAKWLYEEASWEWTKPLGLYGQDPQPADDVLVPEPLSTHRLPHDTKLKAAEQFASGLGGFWNSSRVKEYYFPEDLETFEAAAKQRNLDKQAGFYVDRVQGVIRSPLHIEATEVTKLIMRAAQVLEMHLIEDHTRQQDAPDDIAIDSVQDLHWQILPIAHPEVFTDFIGRVEGDEP